MPTQIVLEGNPDRILFEGFERAVQNIASKNVPAFKKLEEILAFIGHDVLETDFISGISGGYAEPGYERGEECELVVLGSWHVRNSYDTQRFVDRIPELVADAIETFGGSIEWYDEWYECEECYRAVRGLPNSYFWQPYFYRPDEGGVICADCVKNDPSEREYYIEYLLSGKGDTFLGDDLAKDGFTKRTDDLHQGFHPGMDESPEGSLQYFQSTYPNEEFVVVLEDNSQFYYKFSIWGREKKEEND